MSPRPPRRPSLLLLRRHVAVAWPLLLLTPATARADPPSLLDRGVVAAATRRAVERAGLGVGLTGDLSVRARAAGWLPRVSLRVARGTGASASLTYQSPDRATTDDSLVLDVRLTFALDRVVFDSSEVAIARVELERAERRATLERDVIELLGTMERARRTLRTLGEDSPESAQPGLEYARARARLELLTGLELSELLRAR